MKSNKKFIALFLSAFLAISGLFAAFTPYPAVWLVKHIFSLTKYSYPENYEILKSKVAVERDINYNSAYPNGCLDVFYPKENKKDEIIFWVHGGGYVGDDKKKVEHYMTMLASSGYVVISINYALAPKYHYPVQLKQIEEAWSFISVRFKNETAYFGGDSAGAQLISQFINIQVDKKYADEINADLKTVKINEVVNAQRIGGTILFCGPYNLKELLKPKKNTMKLPFKKIGWAYFGTKNVNDKKLELSDIPDNLSDNYPPSFITDGNAFSFENQGKALAAALKRRGIYVKDVFYPKDEAVLKHEYQFNMDTPYAQKTFDALLDFLKVTAEAKTMPAAKLPSQETTTK